MTDELYESALQDQIDARGRDLHAQDKLIAELKQERDKLRAVVDAAQPLTAVLAFDQTPRDAGITYQQLLTLRKRFAALEQADD